jgi:hypothetical protein
VTPLLLVASSALGYHYAAEKLTPVVGRTAALVVLLLVMRRFQASE